MILTTTQLAEFNAAVEGMDTIHREIFTEGYLLGGRHEFRSANRIGPEFDEKSS